MTGFPSPEKLARLTAISRQLFGTGVQPPIAGTIEEEGGYVYGVAPDGDAEARSRIGVYLHSGVRFGWAPLPDKGGVLISIWGGLEPDPGFEEEGVTAFITPDGLRRMAADMRAIADVCEPSCPSEGER